MNKVFIFNGPPNSGKDFICEKLKIKYNFLHLQFKEELFVETCKHFSVSRHWFDKGYTRTQKEVPEPLLNGLSRRNALIFVSEEIIKQKYGKNYFGVALSEQIKNADNNICISDGGFSEEMEALLEIEDKKIVLVRIYRNGCDFSQDSRSYISTFKTDKIIKHGAKKDFDIKHKYTEKILNFPYVIDYYNNGNEIDVDIFLKEIINL